MKKFILKSLPYLLIGLVYALIGEFYLYKFKENISIPKVAEIQSNSSKELYYGRRLFPNNLSFYKHEMIKRKKSEVLILGQSIILQFRDFMFKPYKNVYNTGLMIRNIKDLESVIDEIQTGTIEKPKIILLGLDFSFFLENNMLNYNKQEEKDALFESKSHLKAYQRIFFGGKIREIPPEDYGFGKSGITGRGYRNDGSYRYKPELEQYLRDSTNYDARLRDKLKNKIHPFADPFAFNLAYAKKMKKLLSRIENMNICLISYFPPLTDYFFKLAMKKDKFETFWNEYMKFEKNLISDEFHVIPFITPSDVNLNDDYMIDADHPSEVLCAIQLKKFLSKNRTKDNRLKKIDINNLSKLLEAKRTMPKSFLKDSISYKLVP